MKLSDCCGAAPRSNGDCDTEDFGICPDCKDHCEYIEFCDDCGEEINGCICEQITKNPATTPGKIKHLKRKDNE